MRFMAEDVADAAMAHAIEAFPNESCGGVTAEGYIRFTNRSTEPTTKFQCDEEMAPLMAEGRLLALIHSHPGGPLSPSERDMAQQMAMDIPWGIVGCTAEAAMPPWFWGPGIPTPPLIGRDFRYGPSGSDGRGDCAALVRDWYAANRGIELQEFPRADGSWINRPSLYRDNLLAAGFQRVGGGWTDQEPLVGDVFLMSIRSASPNHVALYHGGGTILHHLQGRLSRVENASPWRQFVTDWFRHE